MENTKYQKFARANYKAGTERDEMWHDAILAECDVIDAEAIAKREAEKARIREVVGQTADISAELSGRIVVKVSFEGSHPKKKALTKTEKGMVMQLPPDVKATIGGDKPLFECEEYDDLISFVSKRRGEFANFGIPHLTFEAAHVTDINYIPEIEEAAERTEYELPAMVEKFLDAWPSAIDRAKERLGPLFNESDYLPASTLRGMFKFNYNWLAFGVPEELKQFDIAIYEKAQAKAKMAWAEIEANGVALLRQTIADLVGGLAESLTPKDGGDKRKFYPSSVEKIVEFIDSFKKRNICKDDELEEQVEKLRDMVKWIDVEKLSAGAKGDDALREKVRAKMAEAKKGLDQLTVSASARVIKLRD
jgi:hypothetical protein